MTRLRLLLAALLVLAAVGSCQPVSATGFVHTSGQQLLDGNDQPLALRGVGLGTHLLQEPWLMGGPEGKGMTTVLTKLATLVGQPATDQFRAAYEAQFITQADIQQIAADGFNVVRGAFNARYLTSQLPTIDNIVNWAAQAGIYVVLDMHAAPCPQNPYFTSDSTDGTADLWYASGCKQQTVNAWQTIATRYASNTTVAAYDLLNEPDAYSTMTNANLTGLYSQIIAAIRTVDPNHVVMVEGRSYTKDVTPFTVPLDPNLILSFHQYASSTTPAAQASQITAAEAAADRLGGVPIWCGEFGLDTAANIAPQVARFNADPRIVGWSYWTWKMAARTDTQDGLNEYTAPASWVSLLNWLTSKAGAVKPTVAQAQAGMTALLVAIGQTTPNTAVLNVLGGN